MKDPIITYRGAKARLSELKEARTEQLQQQQGTRLVRYRGTKAEVNLHPEHTIVHKTVTSRGATGEFDLEV